MVLDMCDILGHWCKEGVNVVVAINRNILTNSVYHVVEYMTFSLFDPQRISLLLQLVVHEVRI